MYRTTIMLPEELKSRVVRESQAMGLSLGAYIREALTLALDAGGESGNEDSLLSDTASYAGEAPPDSSRQHDDYLYGDRS